MLGARLIELPAEGDQMMTDHILRNCVMVLSQVSRELLFNKFAWLKGVSTLQDLPAFSWNKEKTDTKRRVGEISMACVCKALT